MKVEITDKDARVMIAALWRARDWTTSVIDGLKGSTHPSDVEEAEDNRRANRRYGRLRARLERKIGK